MTGKKLAPLLAALLLLCSCGTAEQEKGIRLWFPVDLNAARHSAQAVACRKAVAPAASDVETLVSALLAGPDEDGLVTPFPAGTELLRWSLHDGELDLDFSEEYNTLSGADLTLADYCLTLTLCQLNQVDRVCILAGNGPGGEPVRRTLSTEDVIFTGAEEEPRQISVALYFPRALGKGLGLESRELTLTEDDDLYAMIAGALMKGPEDDDLKSYLPNDPDILLGAWLEAGVCYVNFSSEFLLRVPEGEMERNLLLYSVVDTMGNLDTVTAVQLLVDGERLPTFGGVNTSLPLEPDFGMLSGE